MGLTRKSDISENISTKNKAARLARRTYAEKNRFWMCYFQKSPNLTFDARKFVWRKPRKKRFKQITQRVWQKKEEVESPMYGTLLSCIYRKNTII